MHAPSLANRKNLEALPIRPAPYFNILEYCRHIGIEKRSDGTAYWVARIRKSDGGYRQTRLAPVSNYGPDGIGYDKAVRRARKWFALPKTLEVASTPYPVGSTRHLKYVKKGTGFTVGDALSDYVEWKRLAAAKTTFETNLSLINHHILPRVGDIQVVDFTNRLFTKFCREVLETPPKRGNQKLGQPVRLAELNASELRKRKGTLNTLIGILRLTFQLAWENGEIESDRSWRCLRRVPNYEVPRQIFLTRAQCRVLIAACRPDLADLVRAALYSGCRVVELANLSVGDVGRDVFGIYIYQAKSRRPRHVFLPEEGMRFFLGRCSEKAPDDRVFRTEIGQVWTGNHRHLFRIAVKRAGLPEGFVFHGLRHTYASQLVQAGTPLAVVARQLGHSNTDTVSRTYGHLSCTSIERELEARFAPLEAQTHAHDSEMSLIRQSLQNHDPALAQNSWPNSNFCTANSRLVGMLKGR